MGDFNVEPEDQILTHIRARLYDTAELFSRDLKSFPSDVPEIFPFVYISHPMLF